MEGRRMHVSGRIVGRRGRGNLVLQAAYLATLIKDHKDVDGCFFELARNRDDAVFLSFDSLAGQYLLERADLANQLKPGFFQLGFRKCLDHIAVEETAGSGKITLNHLADKILCVLFQVIQGVHSCFLTCSFSITFLITINNYTINVNNVKRRFLVGCVSHPPENSICLAVGSFTTPA